CEKTPAERQPTSHWSASTDQDRIAEFIELLKGCLREHARQRDLYYSHRPKVKGKKKDFKYLYYAPTSRFSKPPLFEPKDFIDAPGFINSLKNGKTPLAKVLFAGLPAETQSLITGCQNPLDKTLLVSLADGLNELIKNPLYEQNLFDGIILRSRTRKLLDR